MYSLDLNPDEVNLSLVFVSLNGWGGNWNTFDDSFVRIFVLNTENADVRVIKYDNTNKWSKNIGETYFIWV